MKTEIRKYNLFISLSMCFSVISSVAVIFCVFVADDKEASKNLQIICPIIFWLGLLAEQVFIWTANFIRKKTVVSVGKRKKQMLPGVVSFFRTAEGTIADILMIVFFTLLVILMIFKIGEEALQYIFICLLVLSFRFHCILNGKNFRYKKYLVKRKVDKK